MKTTLLAATAALLLALPACFHAHYGGPGEHRRGCCPKTQQAPCPDRPDCPKAQQAPAPCPNCPNCPQGQQAPAQQ